LSGEFNFGLYQSTITPMMMKCMCINFASKAILYRGPHSNYIPKLSSTLLQKEIHEGDIMIRKGKWKSTFC